jgi:FkbM family methyltransferase
MIFMSLNANLQWLAGHPVARRHPVDLAVASNPGGIRMTTDFGPGNHVTGDDDSLATIEVACTTLDEFSAKNPAPRFIKLDVEGHELEVPKGAAKTLANPGLRGLLVETFRSSNWQLPKHRELERLLRSFGFAPCHPNLSGPIEMSGENEGGNNTFYLRLEHFHS